MKAEGLKNTDLMIGDLVEYRNVYLRITSLTGLHVMTEFGPYGLDEIEPIPITPEILEKNGILKSYIGTEYATHGEWYSILYIPSTNWFYIHGNSSSLGEYKYVHELQHALRLCGIDKEIVL